MLHVAHLMSYIPVAADVQPKTKAQPEGAEGTHAPP